MLGTGEQKIENLNAEQIINEIQSFIKALKDCGGWVKRGNGEGWFNHEILADALALINSQEQRIKELTEENERLKAIPEQLHKEMSERMTEERKIERKLAVRKMQERLKEKAKNNEWNGTICGEDIDQIAKEMLESKDDER